jgi:ribosomal protein S18 acetylase RimI-like enzyme
VAVTIRNAEPSDHERISPLVDDWWGGRQMRALLPRLFFEHFRETSFVAEEDGEVVGFLNGFLSQSFPYIHFVGVRPDHRGAGLASELYARFFDVARARGRSLVRCVTSPINEGSIAFHRALGFEAKRGDEHMLFAKRI